MTVQAAADGGWSQAWPQNYPPVASRVAARQSEQVPSGGGAMPTEQEKLEAAYHHFEHWSTERQQFDALLDPDVHWVETDLDLGPGDYRGKAAVMAHLDFIHQQGATTILKSVSQKSNGWEA